MGFEGDAAMAAHVEAGPAAAVLHTENCVGTGTSTCGIASGISPLVGTGSGHWNMWARHWRCDWLQHPSPRAMA